MDHGSNIDCYILDTLSSEITKIHRQMGSDRVTRPQSCLNFPAPEKKDYLVICFPVQVPHVHHILEFFPIRNFTTPSFSDIFEGYNNESKFVRPHHTLVYNEKPNHIYKSFFHCYGRNELYVAGGLDNLYGRCINMPDEFSCIPLDIPSNSICPIKQVDEVKIAKSMNSGKYLPLTVKIGDCIYVLSACPPNGAFMRQDSSGISLISKSSWNSFEVYSLSNGEWEVLPDPPFLKPFLKDQLDSCYESPLSADRGYSYLVLDYQNLFVSDGVCSSVFHTVDKYWTTCDLFAEIFVPTPYRCFPSFNLPYNCSPGFPFRNNAILWKENIYLCLILNQEISPFAAFKIPDGKLRAVEVPVLFDKINWWQGECVHLVDLGDDYFALLYYETDLCSLLTIASFKLFLDEDGVVTGVCNSVSYCHGNYDEKPVRYCFAS